MGATFALGRGARLGKYELLERLASGGFGEVFLARERGQRGFNRLVVVKLLLPQYAREREHVAQFIDEARIWAHLSHSNIVNVYEFGQEGGTDFLAMEYVPGPNLGRILRHLSDDGKTLDRDLGAYIVLQVTRALDYAHNAKDDEGRSLGLVHRDVSPQNVLISIHGDVKLTDFGIARAHNQLAVTESGIVRGKPAYMAPEQLAGKRVDARADVFALGVLLWESTLSRRLFQASDNPSTPFWHQDIPAPRSLDPGYPEELERIVRGALEIDPDKRVPSAAALAGALRSFLASRSSTIDTEKLGALAKHVYADEERRIQGLQSDQLESGPTHELNTGVEQRPNRSRRKGLMLAVLTMIAIGVLAAAWNGLRARTQAAIVSPAVTPAPSPSVATAAPPKPVAPAAVGVPAVVAAPEPQHPVHPKKRKKEAEAPHPLDRFFDP